ncbi:MULTISPECIES: diflavin flavoprotein [unclassified Microcoleus]|uniref:diflavin flavoprotein n=1 Tax=unclassified Microcoleus TaxID=2642155 RepID=UPI002FD45E46
MTNTLTPRLASDTKPRDVQFIPIALDTFIVRSRTWDRLKFEVEYSLQKGTTANSYIIQADKTALFDPPGESFTENYLEFLQKRVDLTKLDYIILGHFNANRSVTIKALLDLAPEVALVCTNPAAISLRAAFPDQELNIMIVRGEETLNLGKGHALKFIATPTPRWPDQLCTYDPHTRIVFTDKLFGAHVCGDQVFDEGWSVYSEDRRYYYDSLHASQAKQVLTAMDKFADLPAAFYAPGHGPIVRYGLNELSNLYREWSQQQNSKDLTVALIYASAYGNTATLAQAIARGITKAGVAVESINCEFAEPGEIKEAIEKCAGFIIGTPTLAGHAPTQIQTALGIVLSTATKSKLAGVFGSFGWSGEAIDLVENKLKDAGYRIGFEPIRAKFKPTAATIHECTDVGTDFAQALIRSQKLRAPKPQLAAGSDRTEQAVGRLVGSLCVVSAKREDVTSAMLASWVSQATFNPPGVTIAVAKDRSIESLMYAGDKFVLNILAEGRQLRKYFMKNFAPGEDRFAGVETMEASNGCLVLTDALAYLECQVISRMECGDHWVVYAAIDNGHLLQNDGVTAVHYRKSGTHY